jgi:hypothetical protein
MWLTAEYIDEPAVADGISELARAGCDKRSIEIFSIRPLELPAGLDRPSRASLIAVIAAIANGGLATVHVLHAA